MIERYGASPTIAVLTVFALVNVAVVLALWRVSRGARSYPSP
jgi:hypothetical protein